MERRAPPYQSSHSVLHTATPPQSRRQNHTSKKNTHHWSCVWGKWSSGRVQQEENRDDSSQSRPFHTPPLRCQLSTGYEPNPVPCSCGPKMPDGQNNAHGQTLTPRCTRPLTAHSQCKHACYQTENINKDSHAISHKNTSLCLLNGSNYSGVLSLTFGTITPFYHLWASWWKAQATHFSNAGIPAHIHTHATNYWWGTCACIFSQS